MSFIDTAGRFPRFLTRAQKWAITNESAPSSSKKWLSTDRRSTRRTSASTSAKMLSALVVAVLPRSSINIDSPLPEHDDLHPLWSYPVHTHGHGTGRPRHALDEAVCCRRENCGLSPAPSTHRTVS